MVVGEVIKLDNRSSGKQPRNWTLSLVPEAHGSHIDP